MATRSQVRNRVFAGLLGVLTVPAAGLVVFFTMVADQKGHPPAAFAAGAVVFIWATLAAVVLMVWSLLALRDR